MKNQKKLSRREAIKLLGAGAGASLLANLPSKWSKPDLTGGTMPAFAQTSCNSVFLEVVSTDGDGSFYLPSRQVGPVPDKYTFSGVAGSTVTWYCQSGCLFFYFDFNKGLSGTTGHVSITTLAGTFDEYYTDSNTSRDIVIELDTGEYDSTNNESGGTAGACDFTGGLGFNAKERGSGRGTWGK